MQSFGSPFHSKITWARIGLIEGYNGRKWALVICWMKLIHILFVMAIIQGVPEKATCLWKHPGDFGGNADRGKRCHSMQSFGGPFHIKITWAGIGLIEGCNRRKSALVICSVKLIHISICDGAYTGFPRKGYTLMKASRWFWRECSQGYKVTFNAKFWRSFP